MLSSKSPMRPLTARELTKRKFDSSWEGTRGRARTSPWARKPRRVSVNPHQRTRLGGAEGAAGLCRAALPPGFAQAHLKRLAEGQDASRCLGTMLVIQAGLSAVL